MPDSEMTPGASASQSTVVRAEHFASGVADGAPDVFSTLALGSLVEKTASEWMSQHLEPGKMSVGAQLVINHTAATPEGLTVTATVTLDSTDGRRFDFSWTATDGVDQVGNGTHQRFVVDRGRFDERLAQKKP